MSTIITPDSGWALATPQIFVDIYPHEGGTISFDSTQGGIISAQIIKNIRDKAGGKFSLELLPGGPNGINDPNTWTSILTMNSLVVISLVRSQSRRIVMVGILTKIEETQTWNNAKVIRSIIVQGVDFTYFFSAFSFYELTYLSVVANSNPVGPPGFILDQFGIQFSGVPAEMAYLWLKYIMLGVDNTTPSQTAVLQNTFVNYKNNNIFLRDIYSYWFEAFVEGSNAVYIPFLTDVVNSEGSWTDKFLANLSWPWYEFFITTAEPNDFPSVGAALASPTTGYSGESNFVISKPNFTVVSPTIVGRINPLPWIAYTGDGTALNNQFNNQRWEDLNIYSLGSWSFIESSVNYNTSEVANFFGITSVDSNSVADAAGSGAANMFGFELMGGILDHYSINSYGFRPEFVPTRWLTIPVGLTPPSGQVPDISYISSVLLGKLASYRIPTPNMLNGKSIFPMWPDVIPGFRFRCFPFKNGEEYEFYIEGVTHNYIFGGPSYSVVELTRGLRTVDYGSNDKMIGLHLDTYNRQNGQIVPRSDIATNAGAYYVHQGSIPVNVTPYYSTPPTILPPPPTTP